MKMTIFRNLALAAGLLTPAALADPCFVGCLATWTTGTDGYDLDSGVYVELQVGFELVSHGVCVPVGQDCTAEEGCLVRRKVLYKASHDGAEIEVDGNTIAGPFTASTNLREAWKRFQSSDCNGVANSTEATITLTVGTVTVSATASNEWVCSTCS
jgi:hypothetical protein